MKYYIGCMCITLFLGCKEKQEKNEVSVEEKARKIHEKVITIDTHIDIDVANFTDSINYTQRLNNQVNLPKLNEGKLDVSWLIVYTGQEELTPAGYAKAKENAMAKFNGIHKLCNEIAPDEIELAYNSDDVRRIVKSGKKVAMIGVENAYPIGEDLSEFENYHKLGARYISLSHNGHSQFCDSNTGEADQVWLHNGLSELGKAAVAEMNRLGIMIDVSHPSEESMKQMIALSKAPIIASHSSARALCNHSRNLTDEQLLMMKENGGVVQAVAFPSYVSIKKLEANEPVTVSDFVDHIDYMVKLIGINHVGISSDFDGGGGIEGWSDASETENITLELVKRGYSEADIAKLWGENLLRVLDQVQAVAVSLAVN